MAAQTAGRSVSFTVYGEGKRSMTSWEELVRQVSQVSRPQGGLLQGPLAVKLRFYLPKPKSATKRKVFPNKKPDLDKLVRAVLDGMSKAVYHDDAQVVMFDVVRKEYGGPPRAEIEVREVPELRGMEG